MAAVSQTSHHAASLTTTFPSDQPTIRPVSPTEDSGLHPSDSPPPAVKPSTDRQHIDPPTSPPPHPPHVSRHGTSPSTTSLPRLQQRSSSGIFGLAAAAFDKTQSAFANISEPVIRPRNSLARLSLAPGSLPTSEPASPVKKPVSRIPSVQSLTASPAVDGKVPAAAAPAKVPLSQPYTETDPNRPLPVRQQPTDNKMHQTSSRLLRMTDDERPFTKVSEICSLVYAWDGQQGVVWCWSRLVSNQSHDACSIPRQSTPPVSQASRAPRSYPKRHPQLLLGTSWLTQCDRILRISFRRSLSVSYRYPHTAFA